VRQGGYLQGSYFIRVRKFPVEYKISWYQTQTSNRFTSLLLLCFCCIGVESRTLSWIHSITYRRFVFGIAVPCFYDRLPSTEWVQSAILSKLADRVVYSESLSLALTYNIPCSVGPVL